MFISLKNDKPSAIFRIKGLTKQNAAEISSSSTMTGTNTAAIGISIESTADVDVQMAQLQSKSGGSGAGGSSADVDSMQVESSNDSLALVRPASLDTAAHTSMAIALAPRIGECTRLIERQ
jgi:hypothetical protein